MEDLEKKAVLELVRGKKDVKGALIPVLQEAQGILGYLPGEALSIISKELRIPLANVYGVASFYSQFRLKPSGRHRISVCMGTACYVRGAERLLEKIMELLKTGCGETTPDLLFSLEQTRCVGACGLAPVVTVGGDVYGNVTPEGIPKILEKYGRDAK